ncbi:glycosyltransferase family 1 protein [Candidatus Microgenomates bacterium CPR3]|nr:glycosyltransferase family 1 protein [Candidatus Microgenomates bacterium CPR3]
MYKSSYALMYAPVNEPYGLVVLEGMRAGLPIIAAKGGGGYEEIIDSSNGYIIRQDAKLWARTYTKLYKRRALWEKYSQQNYTDSMNFSDLKYAQKITRLIDKLI